MIRNMILIGISSLVLSAGCQSTTPSLTGEEAAAAKSAVDAAMALAVTGSGLPATADLAVFLAGFGEDVPTCPAPESTTSGDILTVTLAYGLGCSPVIYPQSVLSGSIVGQVDTVARTVAMTFEEYGADDQTLSGTLTADFGWMEDVVSYDGLTDITTKDGKRISGSMVVQADRATGRITILTAMLTVTDGSGPPIQVLLDDLEMDAGGNGNFRPSAGIAVSQLEKSDGEIGTSIVIECTENTPTTGTVLVTVGSGARVSYKLGS